MFFKWYNASPITERPQKGAVLQNMTIYQELQLNQEGSKALIKSCRNPKEKARHIAIYLFKIFITMVFCMAFVIGYSTVFGDENSVTGVVILLCVLVFRFAEFGISTPHGLSALMVVFAILAFGPRLANMGNVFTELLVNLACIFILMVLGCHNVIMANHSTLVLGYLLLYGYDVTGKAYALRLAGLAFGAFVTGIVFYRNHKKQTYKRGFRDLFREFDLASMRTRWQLSITFGVSTAIFLAGLLGLPRSMWVGIAVMSVLLPFRKDMKKRVKGRIPGNLLGGLVFLIVYPMLPESFYPYIGVIGGIGVGLSATYGWQAVFNSLGAMAIAVSFLGVPGAVFFRIFNNVAGAVYGLVFDKIFHGSLDKMTAKRTLLDS